MGGWEGQNTVVKKDPLSFQDPEPFEGLVFSQVVVTYASTYVLVALSIDRYDAITHPMNFSGGQLALSGRSGRAQV